MSKDQWRFAAPDGQQRRITTSELRAALADGRIAPGTLVWRSGFPMWRPASDLAELRADADTSAVDIPPPPAAMVAVLRQYETGSAAPPPVEDEPPPLPSLPSPSASRPLATQIGGSAYGPVGAGSQLGAGPARSKLGPSFPTMIGMPSMSEASASNILAPRAAPPPSPADSSPTALDSGAFLEVDANNAAYAHLPAPTDPLVPTTGGAPLDDSTADQVAQYLPPRSAISLALDDIRRGRPPRNKAVLAVGGVIGVSLLVLVVAGIASVASGSSSEKEKTTATTTASASAIAATSVQPPTPKGSAPIAPTTEKVEAPPPKSEAALADCVATAESIVIAPKAAVTGGLEATALESGLAIGFAAAARDAVAISLDGALAKTKTVHAKASGDARRVTPAFEHGKLTAIADADRKGDKIRSRRAVPPHGAVDIGVADGALVWVPHRRDNATKLFGLGSDDRVEALRAVARDDGFALTFRQGNAVFVGAGKGQESLAPEGTLSKIGGLGQVGTPSLAVSGDHVLVAWADREDSGSDWKIRFSKGKVAAALGPAATFAVPSGGLGGPTMSPSIAALRGGHFLLAWTEGPVSSHQIRAITVDADGHAVGQAMTISRSGVNAGQPAAAVGADGKGLVAFLGAKGKSFEVHATPVTCAAR